jgi:hypothetical protein
MGYGAINKDSLKSDVCLQVAFIRVRPVGMPTKYSLLLSVRDATNSAAMQELKI